MYQRSSRSGSTSCCSPPGRRTGWSRPATTRSTACGWRRATGRSAPTSGRTRTRSRPGCSSPASSAPTSPSSAARRSRRSRRPAHAGGWSSLVLADPEPMLWGGELVLRDGVAVGQVRSAGWGETLGACVAHRDGLAARRRAGDAGLPAQRVLRGRRRRRRRGRRRCTCARRSTRTVPGSGGDHRPDTRRRATRSTR